MIFPPTFQLLTPLDSESCRISLLFTALHVTHESCALIIHASRSMQEMIDGKEPSHDPASFSYRRGRGGTGARGLARIGPGQTKAEPRRSLRRLYCRRAKLQLSQFQPRAGPG